MQQVLDDLAALPQPSIAAINGFALGGGCELAMACDLRIAADTAKLGVPEVALGVFPGAGGTQRLPRLVGPARAKYLVLTGEVISAEESERIGLVNKVVPKDKLVEEVTALAQKLAAQGPQAVRLAKQSIDGGAGMDLKSAQALENSLFALTFGDEQKEGMSAFIEKRKPNF
jgi:enoyl-CoA hydratase